MEKKKREFQLYLIICIIILAVTSCRESGTQPEISGGKPVEAPLRTLSASEIMKRQGISSIHFVEYDSIIVNGLPVGRFTPSYEYYIDTNHAKTIQYYLDDHYWNVTVYDVKNNLAWNYFYGNLTYMQLPNWPAAYEQMVQARLGSWRKGTAKYTGQEYIDDKLCDVYEDSTGYKEWIWTRYRLPLQRYVTGINDGILQQAFIQIRSIEVNNNIPDVVFEPPK